MPLTRAQIISGFNRDHRHALEDILEQYGGVSVNKNITTKATTSFVTGPNESENPASMASIYSIKLTDLEFDELTITFKHPAIEVDIVKPIAFDYPKRILNEKTGKGMCQSWEDVKDVLIYMSKKAAKKRGFSHIVLKGVEYPKDPLTILLICLIAVVVYGHFNVNSLYDNLFPKLHLEALLFLKPYHSYVLYGALGIHVIEIWQYLVPRLENYRVSTDYAIEWYLMALLDGYPTIRRFDKRVARFEHEDRYWKL